MARSRDNGPRRERRCSRSIGTAFIRAGASLRRQWLRVGSLGVAGLTLADLLRGRATRRGPPDTRELLRPGAFLYPLLPVRRSRSSGHLGPQARRPGRGSRRVPADRHQRPRHSSRRAHPAHRPQAHRFALVRSVAHPDNTHTVAMHYMLTGRRHAQPSTNPQNQPTDFPTFGAVVQYLRPRPGRPARRHQPERAGQPGVGQQPHLPGLLRRLPGQHATTRCSSPRIPAGATSSRSRPPKATSGRAAPPPRPAGRRRRAAAAARTAVATRPRLRRDYHQQALRPGHVAGGRPAFDLSRETRRAARPLRPQRLRPGAAAGPAAGRGGRSAGDGQLGPRRRLLGHARQQLQRC